MTAREQIFRAVGRERLYQDRKWGTIQDRPHTVGEWLLIMERELNEAKEAWCTGRGDRGALEELLQVVSVGLAAMEEHGFVERRCNQLLAEQEAGSRPGDVRG